LAVVAEDATAVWFMAVAVSLVVGALVVEHRRLMRMARIGIRIPP
jgi:hypothetical protein